jgi:uncharacterized membrane protein
LGILLFVAANWDKLARPVKITIIFSTLAFFNLTGNYFRNIKSDYPGLGEGFLLVGAFSFGAGVWLVAQMYQIHYNFSAGIIFWILGILPLIFIYRSWPILTLVSILSLIWLISYQSYYFLREGYGFFLLMPLAAALSYIHKQRFSLFVMITGVSIWLAHFWLLEFIQKKLFSFGAALFSQVLLVVIYAFLGFILYGLGIWHQRLGRFNVFTFLYKFLGILYITLPAYTVTFAHHYDNNCFSLMPSGIATILIILFILGAAVFYQAGRQAQDESERKEIKLVFRLFLMQAAILVLLFNWPKAASLSFNIILLVEAFGFMYLGFLRRSEGVFRIAIVIFFLDILSRYFDIFWKMMPRSLLFIFGGIILIASAIFVNRKRKEIEEKYFAQIK